MRHVVRTRGREVSGSPQGMSFDSAGKLMALPVYREERSLNAVEEELLSLLTGNCESFTTVLVPTKDRLRHLPYWNDGHTGERYRHLATYFVDAIFDQFYGAATNHLREELPLLISGGCGLNCNWNTPAR